MTPQEINEAVARKLGWTQKENLGVLGVGTMWVSPEARGTGWSDFDVPDYCHSIAAAWEVVEHVTKTYNVGLDHWERKERASFTMNEQKAWRVAIRTEPYNCLETFADTAPMAICLAYLKLKDGV